jgi:hypothetical protein
MNSNQGRTQMGRNIAEFQHHGLFNFGLFRFGWVNAFKTKNSEMPEAAGKIGFGYFVEFKIGAHIPL